MLPRFEEGFSAARYYPTHLITPPSRPLPPRRLRPASQLLEFLEPRELLAANPVPVLAVSGNGLNIGFHDTSPRLQDGTDLGALPAGNITASTTFHITDTGSAALTLTDPNPVTFTGTNAADFSVSSLTNNSDGSSTLVVHFAPTAAGTSNATVNIASNDPKHPDFTFAIRGTLAFTDYAIAVGTVKVPAAGAVTDGKTTFSVPVTITNPGGLAVTGTASSAEIQIFLHDTTIGSNSPMTTLAHANLAGLGAVGSRPFTLKVTPPIGFSSGTYTFLAVVNGNNALAETNPLTNHPAANNSAQSAATVTLAQAHVDLAGSLVSTTHPPAVSDTGKVAGKLTVSVNNLGNVTLPANEKISIEVRAHTNSGDIVLGTFNNLSVAGLGAKARPFTLTINDTTSLADGTYQIEAFITPTPAINEDSTENNLLTQTASGQTFTVISAAPFDNITGLLGKSTLPTTHSADTTIKGSLQVTVINAGNVTLAANQQVVLDLFANAFPLANSPILTLGALAPGASKTLTINVNALAGLDAGSYALHVQIDTVPGLAESSFDDNLIFVNAAGAPLTLTVG